MKRFIYTGVLLLAIGCSSGGGSSSAPSASSSGGGIIPVAHAATDTFLKDIIVTYRTSSDAGGVESVLCASNEVLMGGGAFCTGFASDSEAGVLFASYPLLDGSGYLGACYDWSTNQASTPVTTYAVCAREISGQAVVSKSFKSSFAAEEEEKKILMMMNEQRQLKQ